MGSPIVTCVGYILHRVGSSRNSPWGKPQTSLWGCLDLAQLGQGWRLGSVFYPLLPKPLCPFFSNPPPLGQNWKGNNWKVQYVRISVTGRNPPTKEQEFALFLLVQVLFGMWSVVCVCPADATINAFPSFCWVGRDAPGDKLLGQEGDPPVWPACTSLPHYGSEMEPVMLVKGWETGGGDAKCWSTWLGWACHCSLVMTLQFENFWARGRAEINQLWFQTAPK